MIKQGSELFAGKFDTKKVIIITFTAIYFTAVIEFHLIISNFVTFPQDFGLFEIRPRNLAFTGSLIVLFIILLFLVQKFAKGYNRLLTTTYWIISLIFMVIIQKVLMVHPIEIAHYFQYAIGAILVSKVFDPSANKFSFFESFTITALIGTFDEFYQFFYHCPAYCRYLDWMDIWMNIIAAGLGALFVYGYRPYPKESVSKARSFIRYFYFLIASIYLMGFVLFKVGTLIFYTLEKIPPGGIIIKDGFKIVLEREIGVYNSWQKTFHTGYFYVPGPEMGIVVILLLILLYTAFDPDVQNSVIRIFRNKDETEAN